MKPFTKEVLERCTELFQEFGLSRRRRGLGVWAVTEEIQGAITLQHRDFPNGTVQIDTCPQVYWEPVQRLYSAGLSARYRAFENATQSRMWSFINFAEADLVFEPDTVSSENLTRLSTHIERHVLGKVLELAEPDNVLDFYRAELPYGGHRPEIYLCLKAWMNRSLDLDDEFERAINLLSHEEFIQDLGSFYAQLKNSTVARKLINGDGV